MTPRAQRIAAAGRAVRRAAAGQLWEDTFTDVLAAMLDVALPGPSTPRKGPARVIEGVNPDGVVGRFAAELNGEVLMSPAQSNWPHRLRAVLSNMPDFSGPDVDLILDWLRAGGVKGWRTPPTFDDAIRLWGKWTAFAREWNARGRQPVRGDLGQHDQADITAPTWSEFR